MLRQKGLERGGGGTAFEFKWQGGLSMQYQIEHSPYVDEIKRMSGHLVCRWGHLNNSAPA